MIKTKRTILLIDDDAALRESHARQFLGQKDFNVEQAGAAASGISKAESVRPDAIVLNIELPDMDGREVCRAIRKRRVLSPILMLTAQPSDSDAILALNAGANDYIAKPVRFAVLLARARAHLRAYEQSDAASFDLGPYEFRPPAKLLLDKAQRKIRLTDKETDILRHLYKARGKKVPRHELMLQVWGDATRGTKHSLETHIYRLRQKIEVSGSVPRLLVSEDDGYSLQP